MELFKQIKKYQANIIFQNTRMGLQMKTVISRGVSKVAVRRPEKKVIKRKRAKRERTSSAEEITEVNRNQ